MMRFKRIFVLFLFYHLQNQLSFACHRHRLIANFVIEPPSVPTQKTIFRAIENGDFGEFKRLVDGTQFYPYAVNPHYKNATALDMLNDYPFGENAVEMMEVVFRKYQPKIVNYPSRNEGRTPLMTAVSNVDYYGVEAVRFMLSLKADTNTGNAFGDTPLRLSMKLADPITVTAMLIGCGADVNRLSKADGMNTLHYFQSVDDIKKVAYLLEYGGDINCISGEGLAVIHYAIRNDNPKAIMFLIEQGADVAGLNVLGGLNALHYAVSNKRADAVQSIISTESVNPNSKTHDGRTSLMLVAGSYRENALQIADILIYGGADAKVRDSKHRTVLWYCLENYYAPSDIECIEKFMKLGLSLTDTEGNGKTFAEHACNQYVDSETQEFLWTLTPCPCQSCNSQTALFDAAKSSDLAVFTQAVQSTTYNELRARDPDFHDATVLDIINSVPYGSLSVEMMTALYNAISFWQSIVSLKSRSENRTALMTAIESSETYGLNATRFLLNQQANPNSEDVLGNTPLRYALKLENSEQMASLLLENNAQVDYKSEADGLTVLHVAAMEDNIPLVELFLNNGADVNLMSDSGLAALNYAILNDNADLIEMLLDYGADATSEVLDGGRNSLHFAVANKRVIAIKTLIRLQSVDVNSVTIAGKNSLMIAASSYHDNADQVVDTLVEFGAKLTWGQNGTTALWNCLENLYSPSDIACIEKFTSLGLSPEERDNEGQSFAEFACSKYVPRETKEYIWSLIPDCPCSKC